MSSFGKFGLFLLILVILGAIILVAVQQFRGGEVTFFSSLFSNHRDWFPWLPDWAKLSLSPLTPFSVQTSTSTTSTTPVVKATVTPTPPKTTKTTTTTQPVITPPQGFTSSQLSPFYNKVTLASIHAASGNSDAARFSVRAGSSISGTVDVTGWTVRTNKGQVARISSAVSVYEPSGSSAESDILLKANEYVTVYAEQTSPVGKNFRLNRCTGYLNSSYTFNPKLPSNCPAMYERSEIVGLSGECQSFILSFGGCKVPTSAQLNQYSTLDGGACRSFLNRFGYGSCFSKYSATVGFLSTEWRVWLRDYVNFDPLHDRILLYDRSGLLVDEYTY
jgi:hypothetical protein